jgi:hypothetical protein
MGKVAGQAFAGNGWCMGKGPLDDGVVAREAEGIFRHEQPGPLGPVVTIVTAFLLEGEMD